MERKMRLNSIPKLAVALVAGLLISGMAQAADTPETLAGAKRVSAEDVAKVQSSGAVVIDSRVAAEYAEGHIKGAINVPYREKSEKAVNFDASQDEFNLAKLPADKAAAIVIYCNGAECWKSFKASTVAIKGGYTNIHWYRDGFPNWKSKGLPVE
jgi:rhodanese-related sulfurtransferase